MSIFREALYEAISNERYLHWNPTITTFNPPFVDSLINILHNNVDAHIHDSTIAEQVNKTIKGENLYETG